MNFYFCNLLFIIFYNILFITQAIREREAALENIFDKDLTISKFRELVQRLNEQCSDYRNRLNEKDNKTGEILTDILRPQNI